MDVAFGGLFVLALLAIGWKVNAYYEQEKRKEEKRMGEDVRKEVEEMVANSERPSLIAGVRRPSGDSNRN